MHFLFPLKFSIIVSHFNFLQQDDFKKCLSLSKPCKNLTNHQCDMVNHIYVAKHAKKFIAIHHNIDIQIDIYLISINWGFKKSLLKLEIKYRSLTGKL